MRTPDDVSSGHGMLLFDADCGFCTRAASWIAHRSVGMEVTALQSVDLTGLGVSSVRALEEIPYVHTDGRITWGSAAIADALRGCAQPWRLIGGLLATSLVQRAAQPAYRVVARHRHRLPGGTQSCRVERAPGA